MRGAHPPAPADRGLGLDDPFLARPVVVRVVRQARFHPGPEQRIVERTLVGNLADRQRPSPGTPFVGSLLVVLHAPEDRQDVVEAPAAIAELRPGVVVEPLAADEDESVDGARAPQQPPSGNRNLPPAGALVGLGTEAPVGGRIVDELREADRHPAQPVTARTRLQQQHPLPPVRREPVREHAARRPRPDHDEIEPALARHVTRPSRLNDPLSTSSDAGSTTRAPGTAFAILSIPSGTSESPITEHPGRTVVAQALRRTGMWQLPGRLVKGMHGVQRFTAVRRDLQSLVDDKCIGETGAGVTV